MDYFPFGTANVTGGYYDNISGTLMLYDNAGPSIAGHNPVGQVNVLNKSVSGALTGPLRSGSIFNITYHGQH